METYPVVLGTARRRERKQ